MIDKKENEKTEFKKTTSELKEAIISIASILNKHKEGELYFGVNNKCEVVGQCISERTIREISKAISDHIEPKIYPIVEHQKLDGKDIVYVNFKGENIPYYAYGRAYIRVGDENKQLSAKELEEIILKKNKERLRWDNQICKDAKNDDIDINKLKSFLIKANLGYSSVKNSLEKLNLISNDKLLNSAVLVFGKIPQKFFPSAKLRCAVFAGVDSAVIIDRQEFAGDILYLIEEAEKYILKNIHLGMKIDGLYRKDIPEIDLEALREAIINAFCHRDYSEYDSVNIAIFKDRLEIRSPGGLFGGLTIEDIRKSGVSKRRNELIAELFNKIHFVEKWGRGIKLILSKEKDTEFKVIADNFITIFKRKDIGRDAPEKIAYEGVEKLLGLIKENPRISKKELVVRLGEKLGVRLGENEAEIIRKIVENKFITASELSRHLAISLTAVENNISKLKQKGIIKRIGPDKGGYWEVGK